MITAERAATRTEIRIHPATPADLETTRRVIACAYAEYAPVLGPVLYGAYLDDLLDLDGRAAGQVLVARAGRNAVGTATFFADAAEAGCGWPSGWAGVRALAVDPAFRGLGIARRLMDECLRRADTSGADVIGLHTARFMAPAVRLYEGLGFQRVPDFDVDAAALLGVPDRSVSAKAYARPVAPSAFRRRRGGR